MLTAADPAHSGFLPQLIAEGFSGPVFATPGTAALLPIALSEAAAQFAEEAGDWPGFPATPPFRPTDVSHAGPGDHNSLVGSHEKGSGGMPDR